MTAFHESLLWVEVLVAWPPLKRSKTLRPKSSCLIVRIITCFSRCSNKSQHLCWCPSNRLTDPEHSQKTGEHDSDPRRSYRRR